MTSIEYNQIVRVQKIYELDFDSLFYATLPAMNSGTFSWPDNLKTDEEKKEYYSKLISGNLLSPLSFAFKRVIDGRDVSFNCGYRTDDNYFVYVHALVNTIDGSKQWIFNPHITPQQTQYLVDNGFVGIIMHSFGESDTLKHQIKKYVGLANTIVHDSVIINPITNLIQTKVDFISSSYSAETPLDSRLS